LTKAGGGLRLEAEVIDATNALIALAALVALTVVVCSVVFSLTSAVLSAVELRTAAGLQQY
jgi:hypothetical protein